MSLYIPKVANPNDGELLTLCKILEATSGANPAWDSVQLSNYTGTNPGTIVFSAGGKTISTLTLTYDGSGNLLTVTRS